MFGALYVVKYFKKRETSNQTREHVLYFSIATRRKRTFSGMGFYDSKISYFRGQFPYNLHINLDFDLIFMVRLTTIFREPL